MSAVQGLTPDGRTDQPRPALYYVAYNPNSANSEEASATWQCRIDGADASCPPGPDYNGRWQPAADLAAGDQVFEARATESGETGSASLAFRVDLTPPETVIESGPATTPNRLPPFVVSSDDPLAQFECQWSSYDAYRSFWFRCGGSQRGRAAFTPPQAIRPGAHFVLIRAKDPWARLDTTPARRNFVVTGGAPAPLAVPAQRLPTVLRSGLLVDVIYPRRCRGRRRGVAAAGRRPGAGPARHAGARDADARGRPPGSARLPLTAAARGKLRGRRGVRRDVRVSGSAAPRLTRSVLLGA